MQIELEISSIKERIKIGDLEQPVIGQRKVSHIIRVREGEATMIGGLMQASERISRSGIPGLMNIPVIGRWFSSETMESNDADLLVVVVPHIVRAPDISPDNLRGVATGTETIWKVNYDRRQSARAGDPKPAAQPGPAAKPSTLVQPPAGIAAPALTGVSAEAPPTPASEPQPSQPVPEIPGLPPGIPGLARPGGAAAAGPRVVLAPSTIQPVLNSMVTVNVNVETVEDLFAAPMKIVFDNKVLKLMDIKRGAFMAQDGQQVTFEKTIVEDPGGAVVALNRVAGAGGVSGSGTLVTLVFQTVGRGTTNVSFSDLTLRDGKLQPIAVALAPVTVSVK